MINIKLRVANLVKKYGTANPHLLAKALNIHIIRLPLPECTRGFLVRCLRRKYILINEALSDVAERVVICHELGHARLHLSYGYHFNADYTYFVPSKRESEANEYALHLLSYSGDTDSLMALQQYIVERRPDPREVHRLLNQFS